MFKRIGMSIVACGVLLGLSCGADAAVVTRKVTTHTAPHRTTFRTHRSVSHRPVIRRGVHKNFRKVSTVTTKNSNVLAGRFHHRMMMRPMVRYHRVWMS